MSEHAKVGPRPDGMALARHGTALARHGLGTARLLKAWPGGFLAWHDSQRHGLAWHGASLYLGQMASWILDWPHDELDFTLAK